MSKAIRQLAGDETLPSDSIIHWGQPDPETPIRAPKRFMITCGGCGLKRYAYPKNETGLCRMCSRTRSRRTDDFKLPSGSIIHFGERVVGDRKRAMVTCGQCGVKHEMWVGDRYRRTVVGYCPKCTRKEGTKNPCMRDGLDETLPSGSIVHWGERDPQSETRAMVTCIVCGSKRMTTIQKRKGWTGICYEHRGAAATLAIVRRALENDSAQKNKGPEKRRRGRESYIDYVRFIAQAKSYRTSLKASGHHSRKIKRADMCAKFAEDGEIFGPSALLDRLKVCGYEDFGSFIEAED